jgi:drug/metabolite transporter (DMT)-like permease
MLPNSPEQRRIGIALVSFTTLMFACLDALAKHLVQELPVLQVVWLRFATHVLIMAVLLWPQHGRQLVTVQRPRLHFLRGLMMCAMTALNFWALQYLQLAETGAMQFSVPILIAVFSAWWLGERLDKRRWLAILAGFVGVLIIIRPGSQAFHPAILLTLLNAILYASFNLLQVAISSALRGSHSPVRPSLAVTFLSLSRIRAVPGYTKFFHLFGFMIKSSLSTV